VTLRRLDVELTRYPFICLYIYTYTYTIHTRIDIHTRTHTYTNAQVVEIRSKGIEMRCVRTVYLCVYSEGVLHAECVAVCLCCSVSVLQCVCVCVAACVAVCVAVCVAASVHALVYHMHVSIPSLTTASICAAFAADLADRPYPAPIM